MNNYKILPVSYFQDRLRHHDFIVLIIFSISGIKGCLANVGGTTYRPINQLLGVGHR